MQKIFGSRKLLMLLLLLLTLLLGSTALAEANPLDDFDYTLLEDQILLQKYKGTASVVDVAGSYEIDGVSYGVTLDCATVFAGNTTLTSVTLGEGIRFAATVEGELVPNSMQGLFKGCLALTQVDLSAISTAGVTDMSYLFSDCQKLKALDLSNFDVSRVTTLEGLLDRCYVLSSLTGYENWNTRRVENMYKTFNRVSYSYSKAEYHDTRLQTIDLSNWKLSKLKNSAWCFQNCHVNNILLPDSLPVISAGFFNHAAQVEGSSYTIPAGVKKIGYAHTFYDFGTDDFVEFKVAKGNGRYKAVDGILYSKDGTEMLAIPRGKTFPDNTFVIPEGVTFLPELSFSRNYNLKRIVLPNSYVLRQYVPQFDPQYITYEDTGNLNDGNSLTIATYVHTGITDYDVKDSNPRYAAHDGILYTKDMTTLLAVPNMYDRLIIVPEGVTHWEHDAIWVGATNPLKNCAGVSIPASMTVIAPNQVSELNRLCSKFAAFSITVHPDNPVYYVDDNGVLQERPNVYGAVITLDPTEFTYDGKEKTPAVTVTVGDEIVLEENKDYTVTYLNNINAGAAQVQIQGMGDYIGTATESFTIAPMRITDAFIRLLRQLIYTGSCQTQPFELDLPDNLAAAYTRGVRAQTFALDSAGDLDVTYTVSGNSACQAGVYQMTVRGTGNFTGTVSCLYEILPDTSLLDTLNEENVTPAHLPALLEIRDMMAHAEISLADAATQARYDEITEKCEMLIALLTYQAPATGDSFSPILWSSILLLCAAGLYLLHMERKTALK